MRLISIIAISLFLMGCKKDEVPCPSSEIELENGIIVLCEGLFQQNNSTLSWIDFSDESIDNQFFTSSTNLQLGDTGNDIQRYGGKIYVVVNISSTIEVLSASNFSSIKQIEMIEGTTAKQPRSIAFSGGNAYVTCYDGYVDVIDTVSLTVTNRIPVGSNPEGLAVANNKLYVANSGGLSFPNPDSTLSIIDLNTNSEIDRITVGLNPGKVIADNAGDIYVISRGNYSNIPSRLKRVNSITDQLEGSFDFDLTGIASMNDNFLVHDDNSISIFNPTTDLIESNNFVDVSQIITLYKAYYNSSNDRIYVCDAMNYTNTGYVRVFNASGVFEREYHVGLIPSKLLFYD